MLLSIIVPVYNMTGGGKLAYCLRSLLEQNLSDYEIIAVDDKSTDDSLKVLYDFRKEYGERLKVIASPENRKQGGARNLGLSAAAGDWIGFVDSDDWVAKDMFSKLLDKAAQTGADVVGCDYLITDTLGGEEGTPVCNNNDSQTGILDEDKYRDIILTPGSMVIKIYRRAIFTEQSIQFPEKMFYEDNAICAFPLLYAKRFERVDECLYYYYQHDASTVHVITTDKCRDRMRAMEIFMEEAKKRGFYPRFAPEIEYKLYELGYRNTLFSYVQTEKHPDMQFLYELRDYLLSHTPPIQGNFYYQEKTDAETKKLTALHLKNPRRFLLYYRLLHFYRKLRGHF